MNWSGAYLLSIVFFISIFSRGNNYSFTRISVENGLSNNQVNTIYKDSYGFVWFGTIEGLDRYDGVEIRPYSQKFPEAVENVYSISEDSEKQLWVGTATGLFFRNNSTDRFERVNISEDNIAVRTMAFLSDSILCVGSSVGVFFVNQRTKKAEHILINEVSTEKQNYITGIFPDNHGNCWFSTHNGLVRFSVNNRVKDYFFNNAFPNDASNLFTSICNIGNKIYLGTGYMGIFEFDLSTKTFSSGFNIDNKIVLSMSTDSKDRLFVGTDGGGLKIINVKSKEVVNVVNQEDNLSSLSSNSIYSFYLDLNDRFWVGTYSGGVNFTNSFKQNFHLHPVTSKYIDANKSIRSFYFAPDGSQYFGTRNGLIQILKGGNAKTFQIDSEKKMGLRSNIILSMYPYKGDILIGTYGGGISLLNPHNQNITPFLNNSIFDKGNTYAFETDTYGNLWIATFSGIYRYSPVDKKFLHFDKQNCGLNSDEVFELYFDSTGRLWVGTMFGLSVFKINGEQLEKLNVPWENSTNFKVNYIYEDQVSNIWVCTERGGLVIFDQRLTKATVLSETDGLPDNSVCAVIEGNTGEYWISTLKGFCKYTAKNKRFTRYSLSDGLPGLVFSPAASYISPDGNIYFGNEKGLVYFNPTDIDGTSKSERIQITDFYVLGKTVSPGAESGLSQTIEATHAVQVSYRSNSIGFRFVCLNYVNPTENFYEYKLEGYDSEWRNNGNSNTVFYEKLKPGNYVFKVRNANETESNAANTAEIKIHVNRSLFNSPFFLSFIFIFIVVGVYFLIRHINTLRNKESQVLVSAPIKVEKYKGTKIPESQSSVLINEIRRIMEEEKPYLNADFKIADLASGINYPLHEISQVLNQDLNQSFPDFVNKYRVGEVIKRLEDKAYDRFTFFAIAQQCGFNSKTSFYRIFKNETGKTPADFVKDLEQN